MKTISNGFFITVEGIDGSGKSSIVHFLAEELAKHDFSVIKTKEPGATSLGSILRTIIISPSNDVLADKAEFLLFAADRAQHVHSVIVPALSQGSIIISDRGAYSSLAYQGYGKGLNTDIISTINSWIMGDIHPDLVIYLKIDYKTAMKRVASRGEAITSFENKGEAYFQKVIKGFDEIVNLRLQESPLSVLRIDATQDIDYVKKEVLDKVLNIIWFKNSGRFAVNEWSS